MSIARNVAGVMKDKKIKVVSECPACKKGTVEFVFGRIYGSPELPTANCDSCRAEIALDILWLIDEDSRAAWEPVATPVKQPKVEVTKVKLAILAKDVINLVLQKNADYADAWQKQGMPGVCVRLSDKLCRVSNILGKEKLEVPESLKDTLMDIIGYAFLGLLYLKDREER